MIEDIFIRFLQLLWVPLRSEDIIWIVAPLLFGLVMINMYFGKYKTEQLGWNTAYANTISLMWVIVLLCKELYMHPIALALYPMHGYLVLGLAILTIVLAYFNYQHALPRKWAFVLSSALPTSAIAYLVVVIVLGGIPVDINTLIASLIFYGMLVGMFWFYRNIITSPPAIEKRVEEKKKQQKKERKKLRKKIAKAVKIK